MSTSEIIALIFVAVSVVLSLLATFYRGKSKIFSTIAGWILSAESTYGAGTGTVKMSYVVGKLYDLLPAIIRPFLPETLLQTFVQTVFDKIQAYAQLQVKQLAASNTAAK